MPVARIVMGVMVLLGALGVLVVLVVLVGGDDGVQRSAQALAHRFGGHGPVSLDLGEVPAPGSSSIRSVMITPMSRVIGSIPPPRPRSVSTKESAWIA